MINIKHSLKYQYIAIVIGITICLCALLSWYFVRQAKIVLRDELEKRGLSIARSLAHNSKYGVLTEDKVILNRLIEGVIAESDIAYVEIYDIRGQTLVEQHKTLEKRGRLKSQELSNYIATALNASRGEARSFASPLLTPYWSGSGEMFIDVTSLVVAERINDEFTDGMFMREGNMEDEKRGFVRIGLSLANMNKKIKNIIIASVIVTLCIAGIGLGFGIGTVVVFMRQVTRPIEKMAEVANEIADGDLTQTVPVSSKDEIGKLANAFNKMTGSLRERTNELRRKANELLKSNEELERANRVKSEFLSNVSHELRTPLTSIRSFSEILLTYEEEDQETQREFIQIINDESERLTRLINDVLDISKIEAGKMDWHIEALDIAEVIDSAANAMRGMAENAGLNLNTQVRTELPFIQGDRDRLMQVLTNLLNNAVKFTENGYITVGAEQEEGEVRVFVSDTGVGIAEEYKKRVFEKFVQVGDTLTDKPEGTGLGLPICKEIVDYHEGKI